MTKKVKNESKLVIDSLGVSNLHEDFIMVVI